MKIEGVEIRVVRLGLRTAVRSAGLIHRDKTTLFVRVLGQEGSGWGECSAYPDAREPDPTPRDIEPRAIDRAVRRLFGACHGARLPGASRVLEVCGGNASAAERSAAAALEMAVLDMELCSSARSLASFLGSADSAETGAMVGIPPNRNLVDLLDVVGVAMASGARRIRVKIEPGWEHVPLEALRTQFSDVPLYADANGSFQPAEKSVLTELDTYGLRCLEQPFAPDDLESHRRLAERMSTPIGLDESLTSPERTRQALAMGACRVACVKPGRMGGVFAALAAASACVDAGVDCFVGGFFESGLGRCVNATLAGVTSFGIPSDLSDPDGYLEMNPFTYLVGEDGLIHLSAEPGLGSQPRWDVLAAHTVATRWVPYEQ